MKQEATPKYWFWLCNSYWRS